VFTQDQQFANFRIIRKLGEGGMGEVYLAEDQKLGRTVAIKILQSEFFDDAERRQRFVREAKTAAKISHANVMAIYDMDSATDDVSGRELSYIVMENVTGQTLTDYLKTRTPGISELLRLAEKIAAGLAAAHKLNIVHRDIKPDNIKIDEGGEVKILDVGLAKPLDIAPTQADAVTADTASNELTQDGRILGTVSYMSPEQARGGPLDTRSDIFSYGVLVYRMFTGQAAFEAGDKVSVLAKILEGRHVPLRRKNESIPAELERIVDKCLQKDPNDRYQDTRDLVVDLRSLRRQYDSGISDSSSISRSELDALPKTYVFKLGWRKVLLALAAVAVIVVGVVLIRGGNKSARRDDALANLKDLGDNITRTLADKGLLGEDGHLRLPALPAQANALAILGFENKTGDAELDWLQAGLPEILLTDLAQSGSVNLIGRSRVLDMLRKRAGAQTESPSHEEYVTAARSLGAATILSGAFYRMGDDIRIDARLEDANSGQIIAAEKVVGDDPFVLVDSLTEKIAQSLDVQAAGGSDREVADITSSSPEAFREYILGMEKFRLALYDDANVFFEKAIVVDSTFALPYMRIGMGYALRGRNQQATQYFTLAQKYENKLPVKERSLLDIYKELWLNQQFDDGMVKMQAYVSNYPDDKEARSFYAILLYQLNSDRAGALAQLDTVMALDPTYMMALSWCSRIYTNEEEYEMAIEYNLLMKRYHPESPEPYQNLMSLYRQQSQEPAAIATAQDALVKFPRDATALVTLMSCYIIERQFDSAAYYVEEIRKLHSDDPYLMIQYHMHRSNLDFWNGKFRDGMDELFKSAKVATELGDSTQIFSAYSRIAGRYQYLDMPDSALYYSKTGYRWASLFQSFAHFFTTVQLDPSSAPQIRPEFEKNLRDFRTRLPESLWGLADEIQKSFDAWCNADTAALIEVDEALMDKYDQSTTENRSEAGIMLVLTGHYEEGKLYLEQVTGGQHETVQARFYLRSRYYTGIAEEALGHTGAAVDAYREVLKYWGDADIQTKLITDARERLAQLAS